MRRFESVAMGLIVSVLAIGVAVMVLSAPWFTRALASRVSQWEQAGLARQASLLLAEDVRAFVIDGAGTLPERVNGREGFDASAVSHLADVNSVIGGATMATGVCAALVVAWVALSMRRRRWVQLRDGLRSGAVTSVVLVALAALAGFADFDSFFSAFHGLFFAAGTWTFPSDSLLIQLFPEPFWIASGAAWAALVVGFATAMWFLGARMDGIVRRLDA